MRVLAALSGGVDSAVAAAKAVEAGHEVVGVHMALPPSLKSAALAHAAAAPLKTRQMLRAQLRLWGFPSTCGILQKSLSRQ